MIYPKNNKCKAINNTHEDIEINTCKLAKCGWFVWYGTSGFITHKINANTESICTHFGFHSYFLNKPFNKEQVQDVLDRIYNDVFPKQIIELEENKQIRTNENNFFNKLRRVLKNRIGH